MRVTVRLFARLRDIAGSGELTREAPAGANVHAVWQSLVSEYPELSAYEKSIWLAAVKAPDAVRTLTPITANEVTVSHLQLSDKIDPAAYLWVALPDEVRALCAGKPDALLHHSDQGTQYTSQHFQELLADNGIVCSMSRSGNVWDNAAMESFVSSLKTERIRAKVYRTRDAARADVFDYIERFYNTVRRHSTIGYLSPVEFEKRAELA